jgi:hypothetical protein
MHTLIARARRTASPVLAAALAGLALNATAATSTTTYSATFENTSGLPLGIPLQVPGFSGPGTLIGVYAELNLELYDFVVTADAQNSGTVSYQAGSTLTLQQPAAFQISPTALSLSATQPSQFVAVGNGQELGGAGTSSPVVWSYQTNANLSPFSSGPFDFTLTGTGSVTGTLPDGITLFLVGTAVGKLSVTYTSAVADTPPIPEPGTSLLLAGGLAAVAWHRQRRRR